MEIKLTGTNMTVRDGYIRMNVDNQYKLVNLKFEEKSNRDAFPNNTLFTAKMMENMDLWIKMVH